MSSLEVEISLGHIRAIPVVNPAPGAIVLTGSGELMGWSFRESGAETGLSAEGAVVSPAAGATIVSIPNVPVGVYTIAWEVQLIGAAAAADQDNFVLASGATNLEVSLNAGAAGQYPQTTVQFAVTSVQTIAVKAVGAGTVGVTYAAQVTVTPVTAGQAVLELQDGNQPLAEISAGIAGSLTQWYGPEGVRFLNRIQANPVIGQMTGTVYARFSRGLGYT